MLRSLVFFKDYSCYNPNLFGLLTPFFDQPKNSNLANQLTNASRLLAPTLRLWHNNPKLVSTQIVVKVITTNL